MASRTVRLAAAVVAVLFTSGCAHEIELRSTSSALSPAANYVTFFVLAGNSSGNPEVDQQLTAGIEAALADKGLVETSPGEAEAVVVVHTATPARHSRDAFYEGWGGWAWRDKNAASPAKTETYTVGSVVIDIFDAWTKNLVWHGFTRQPLRTESNESVHALKRAVTRMFAAFPPPGRDPRASAAAVDRSGARADTSMSIIFSSRPGVLVEIHGEPQYEDIDGTALQRVVNANAFIIRDETGIFYLKVAERWMEAYDVIGPWSFTDTLPDGADVAVREATHRHWSDPFGGMSAHVSTPVVFVTTTPAALIVTDGEPEFASVDGTSLLYIKNTTGSVFKEPTDKELYVHLSRGWFRAWTTDGPWQPVSEADLPADLIMKSGSRGNQAQFNRLLHELRVRFDAEELHDAVLVEFDGSRADIEQRCHFLHRFAFGQKLQHFSFSRTQVAQLNVTCVRG
jgi:hypothetical protein